MLKQEKELWMAAAVAYLGTENAAARAVSHGHAKGVAIEAADYADEIVIRFQERWSSQQGDKP